MRYRTYSLLITAPGPILGGFAEKIMTEQLRTALDALDLLMADHREIESLFKDFEHGRQKGFDTALVIATVCMELKMHDTLETEIFYPAIEMGDETVEKLVGQAEEEHDMVLELMENLGQARSDHRQRDACFNRIIQQVKRHVLVEETELFPLVRNLDVDLEALAVAMIKRKAALLAEAGVSESPDKAATEA